MTRNTAHTHTSAPPAISSSERVALSSSVIDSELCGVVLCYEVRYLEVAVGVDEQVGGFEVAVDDVRRVQVLESPQDLIQEVLHVLVAQRLLACYDGVQVAAHQLAHHVYVVELLEADGPHHAQYVHYVGVAEAAQQLHLAEGALGLHEVVERFGDLLNGHLLAAAHVQRAAHHSVRAVPDGTDQTVNALNVEPHAAHHVRRVRGSSIGRRVGRARCCCRRRWESGVRRGGRGGGESGRVGREGRGARCGKSRSGRGHAVHKATARRHTQSALNSAKNKHSTPLGK